ncbi:MAG TPA: Rieske 2Fe-2S domain-containing protein [Dehalococcoidia bacterium]|nr:Rieske 2Fe-2S domain-containing protein [Dehalococcoidia bacterium]
MTSDTEAKEAAEATTDEGSSAAPSDAWRKALATRRTQQHPDQGAPGAQASRIGADVSRRAFVQGSFWTGLGITLLGFVGMLLDLLYPRNVKGFGGPVPGGNVADYPVGGEPKHFVTGQFFIVNLDPAETRPGGSGGGDGLLALWHRCPHLGCTVPWRAGFAYGGDSGWFRCPCHGSTYTKAGVRVFGPAARSMDTMKIDIDASGNITVQTGSRTPGGPDNPQRAGSA